MSEKILNLKSKISNLPAKPGVYLYKDKNGKVIYIGKAKNLRARVRQYFNGSDERTQIPFLLEELKDFDYTIVDSELESLYLENTLIKQYLPKYNILLRDDKNYAFIKFDYSTEIPQMRIVRKVDASNTRNLKPNSYFGPYSSALKIKSVLKTVRNIFTFCANEKVTDKPCFYYHLHRCPGVCIGFMSVPDYVKHLEKIKQFIGGKTYAVHRQLVTDMQKAARSRQFERAARLRDQIKSLELFEQRQSVILTKKVSWDIISLASDNGYTCVNLFKIREGKLKDKENFVYKLPASNLAIENKSANTYESDTLQKFLENYYLETSEIAQAIYVQTQTKNFEEIKQLIKNRFNKNITLISPQKNKPKALVKMGAENAKEYLGKWLRDQALFVDRARQGLLQLKEVLNLPEIPKRIECYDISNTQGTNPVGSMVVFIDGKPAKSQYRKFKIRSKDTPDDFTMMREMLERRFQRIINFKSEIGKSDGWATPDLIVIDGGKGQLGVAATIIQDSKLPIPVIGLAKRVEEIFLPNNPVPILLAHDQPGLQLLQNLRDEAHRFGITFHRLLRSKQAIKSALDDISGIGPKTKKLLKQKFGSLAEIKKAGQNELAEVVGESLARKLKQLL